MKNDGIVVVGTRPNLVKLPSFFKIEGPQKIVWIGQHWDKELTDFVYKDLDIPEPEVHKEIGSSTNGQADFIAKAITATHEVIEDLNPKRVYVVGDCNVTLAAAIAAKKAGKELVHIEAGCRAEGIVQEELNRRAVDQIADILYAPDTYCLENLYRENVKGRPMLSYNFQAETLRMFGFGYRKPRNHVILTIHRRENLKKPKKLAKILGTILANLGDKGYKIIFSVHPHTKEVLKEQGLWDFTEEDCVEVTKPLPYKQFLELVANSSGVITDSGGLQVEADVLEKPCITLRDNTEWVGTTKRKNTVTGLDPKKVSWAIKRMITTFK